MVPVSMKNSYPLIGRCIPSLVKTSQYVSMISFIIGLIQAGQSLHCILCSSSVLCLLSLNLIISVLGSNFSTFLFCANTCPCSWKSQSRSSEVSSASSGSSYLNFTFGLHGLFATLTAVDPSGCFPSLANCCSSSVADDAANVFGMCILLCQGEACGV